jgi:prevent-host-death family protein
VNFWDGIAQDARGLGNEHDQHSHVCYNRFMRTVNISDLKARLSAHIQHVRDGEELLVCDRNKPVARIIPCSADGEPERERRLIARGIMTPPKRKRRSPLPAPAGNVSDEVMERIWREERDR